MATRLPALQAEGISKHYGAVTALKDVHLQLAPGEVLGIVGDNGAGKSTLMQILSGGLAPSRGQILLDGQPVAFRSPSEARDAGIETVYQDLALAPDLTVWENMFLGREQLAKGPARWLGVLDKKAMVRRSHEELARTKIRIPSAGGFCRSLSGGQRQAIAVARAVAWGSKILLMDEPTAALGVEQQARVGELVRSVRDHGVGVAIVSHNLPQVKQLCDRVAVLFRGQLVATLPAADASVEEIVMWITGAGAGRGNHA
jgi:ABC-type sugar transport system ATPase subunit